MKKISERTAEIIRSLYDGNGAWSALISKKDTLLAALEEIAASQEAAAIPYLTSLLLDSRPDLREATARTLETMVSALPAEDYAQLDQATRNEWAYESTATSAWRQLKPGDVAQFRKFPSPVAALGLLSFHGSGFVREAAVNELAKVFAGSELPFLLLRLNDWVGTVRESAALAVMRRIRPDYAQYFFRNLWLVDRLKTCGRNQHAPLIGGVMALLKEPAAANLLREGIASQNRWLRKQSFGLAIEAKSSESFAILKQALFDRDPILRLWAARNLLTELPDEELTRHLPALLGDRFMPVRCEALSVLARRLPGDAQPALMRALMDTHSSLRAAARYFIRQMDKEFAFADYYRRGLSDGSERTQRISLMGLGETGQKVDCSLVLPYAKSNSPRLRKEALRTLAALDGESYAKLFFEAVTDDHAGVSREATKALIAKCRPLDADLAWRVFKSETRQFIRKNALSIVASCSLWCRGRYFLLALGDADAVIAKTVSGLLRDWLDQSGNMPTGPTNEELALLKMAVAGQWVHLSKELQSELDFCLRGYS